MSNLFEQVLNGVNSVDEKYLGPTYKYYNNIKTPKEIGMSGDGNLDTLAKDIDGLIQYVSLLVSGNSRASATGGPLGNKFFLPTGAKCAATNRCANPSDPASCEKVERYIYVNNVPSGNIPFISQGLGVNFSEFKGLIPGTMSNLNVLNPMTLMQSFLSGSTPPCQEITMETITPDNIKSSETHYVTVVDIKNMDPCSFTKNGNKNPLTGQTCRETFTNIQPSTFVPDDYVTQLYFTSLAGLGIYILYRMMEKSNE
jgi:hypothetical protein